MRFGKLAWTDIEPFGAEVDCDLRESLTVAEQQRLRELLFERQILVFRDQHLSETRQIEIMRYIGPVRAIHDFVHKVSNDKTKGSLGTQELTYHSDLAFAEEPRLALSLHALDIVDGGSSTRYVSGVHAAGRLPAALKERLRGLTALHTYPGYDFTAGAAELPRWVPRHSHPVLMPHPVTGRPVLYVTQMQTALIDGLPTEESSALIQALKSQIYTDDNLYEHVWRDGDLVIWDNIATQHARGDVSASGPRTLQKVQISDRTFAEQWPLYSSDEMQAALRGYL